MWLLDTKYAETLGIETDNYMNRMNWFEATEWASSLNIGGVTGWRLPKVESLDGQGNNLLNDTYAYSGTDYGYNVLVDNSEFAYLSFVHLGNQSEFNSDGDYNTNSSPFNASFLNANTGKLSTFIGLTPETASWTGSEYFRDTEMIWSFSFNFGYQEAVAYKDEPRYAWVVRDGDIMQVPAPSTFMLFGLSFLAIRKIYR